MPARRTLGRAAKRALSSRRAAISAWGLLAVWVALAAAYAAMNLSLTVRAAAGRGVRLKAALPALSPVPPS